MVKPLVFDGIPEGLYYITSYGRLYSTTIHRFVTKKNYNSYYNTFFLRHEKTVKQIRIHTVVGRAFLPDYKSGLLICHKDETLPMDKIDNVNNLFVGTASDNAIDAVRKGRVIPPKRC